ncbi:hypothetical protein [Streptomyces botrytidirepellens]|uniref:Uncharacterized protein n=1 Tax=Streptomyces botrytidirepellens TaxID=2486417 RepID=A0A3M8VWF0_9ACTN|nr:hypothetical protein [Streptomyces botrytidirepellens]RNG22198.1 hypothetical protein EEJ42_21830 [Streptomyces botrytidirepellens]
MFCKRVAMKIKKAKAERLAEREIVEALIGNYRMVLKHIDEGGPAQEALAKAAAMTAEVRQTLEGLDEEASVDEVAMRLEGRVSPAVLALVKAQVVQAGGFGAVTRAVDGFGGFAKQYEQIEKVSAHHGDFWEVLLYGQIGRDRAVMFDLADNDKLKFTATSEDSRVLDALAHAQRHQAGRGDYITAFNEEGKEVDISFATQNWRKAVVDTGPGSSCASTSRRWSLPRSPRSCAPATSRWSARRSTPTGPSSCWPGRSSRRRWGPTWWRSVLPSRARVPSSTPRSSAGNWRTSCEVPPRRRTPGTRRTMAW